LRKLRKLADRNQFLHTARETECTVSTRSSGKVLLLRAPLGAGEVRWS